ncbi:MAG: large repetitive protein, partial [Gaiellaceae bacterium]|nr:large repetitive protein [Gaiellaceae bacterium]
EPLGELGLVATNKDGYWWGGPYSVWQGPFPGWCGPGSPPFPGFSGGCDHHTWTAWHGTSVWTLLHGNRENPGLHVEGASDAAGLHDTGSLGLPVSATPSAKLSQIEDIPHLDSRDESLLHRIVVRGQLTSTEASALSLWDAQSLRNLVALGLVMLVGGVYVPTDRTWIDLGLADPPRIGGASSPSTHSAGVTLTGTGDAGDTITIYDGTTVLGTTIVRADGTWTLTVHPSVGRHTLTARQTVNARPRLGLTSDPSNCVSVTVLPDAPAYTAPQPAPTLRAASVPVTGTGDAGDVISVYDGSRLIGQVVVASDGTWTLTVGLAVGSHALTATQSTPCPDSRCTSLTSPAGATATVVVSLPTPAAPAIGSAVPGKVSRSSTSTSVSGTGVAGDTVTLYDGATAVGTATVASTGKWTVTVQLASGTHTLTATQQLPGGPASTPSASFGVSV